MIATVSSNKIAVEHSVCHESQSEYLTVNVPNGWDDVRKIMNKVLTFNNRDFTFSGWNSDRNQAYFVRKLSIHNEKVAVVKKKV